MPADTPRAWILQTDPKQWDIARFIRDTELGKAPASLNWPVDEAGAGIRPGDRIFLWSGGDDRVAGVLALGRAASAPGALPDDGAAYRRSAAGKVEEDQARVTVEIERVLPRAMFRVKLQWDPDIDAKAFLPDERGLAFPLDPEQAEALEKRCLAVTARPRLTRRPS
jgi:EVE domain